MALSESTTQPMTCNGIMTLWTHEHTHLSCSMHQKGFLPTAILSGMQLSSGSIMPTFSMLAQTLNPSVQRRWSFFWCGGLALYLSARLEQKRQNCPRLALFQKLMIMLSAFWIHPWLFVVAISFHHLLMEGHQTSFPWLDHWPDQMVRRMIGLPIMLGCKFCPSRPCGSC